MRDKLIRLLLSFDDKDKEEILSDLKKLIDDDDDEELKNIISKKKGCYSLCMKNCNDCDLKINTNINTTI